MELEFKAFKNQFSGAKHAVGWYRGAQYMGIRYLFPEPCAAGAGTQVWRVVYSASRLLRVRSQNLVPSSRTGWVWGSSGTYWLEIRLRRC